MAVVQTQSWSWSSAVRQTNTHQLRQINLQTRLEPANHLKMVLVLVWCTCALYGMCTAVRCCSRPSLGHLVQGKLLSDKVGHTGAHQTKNYSRQVVQS